MRSDRVTSPSSAGANCDLKRTVMIKCDLASLDSGMLELTMVARDLLVVFEAFGLSSLCINESIANKNYVIPCWL